MNWKGLHEICRGLDEVLSRHLYRGSVKIRRIYKYCLQIDPLKPRGSILITYFSTLKFCILPTECICVSRMVLTINSDSFLKQH
jgi:hypothetical protein